MSVTARSTRMTAAGSTRRRPAIRAAAGVSALLLVLTACGEDEPDISDSVPESIASDEALVVGVAPDAPPFALPAQVAIYPGAGSSQPQVFSTGGVTGVDVDIVEEAADRLGLDVDWVEASFEDLLTGVEDGSYEAAAGGITVTEERAGQATFVTYLQGGTQWGALRGNPSGVQPNDACGDRVALQRGTVFEDLVDELSAACQEADEDEIEVDLFTDLGEAVTSVLRGRSDAFVADQLTIDFYANLSDARQPAANTEFQGIAGIGSATDVLPYGIAVSDADLATALQSAVQEMIDDGTYEEILDDWTVPEASQIDTSEATG